MSVRPIAIATNGYLTGAGIFPISIATDGYLVPLSLPVRRPSPPIGSVPIAPKVDPLEAIRKDDAEVLFILESIFGDLLL